MCVSWVDSRSGALTLALDTRCATRTRRGNSGSAVYCGAHHCRAIGLADCMPRTARGAQARLALKFKGLFCERRHIYRAWEELDVCQVRYDAGLATHSLPNS